MAHTMDDRMRRCIDECSSCRDICLETVTHCLQMGGRHAAADHIGALLDCADACELAAKYMLRSSSLHQSSCSMCADACDACARSCDTMGEDELMRRCAEECRRCADSCRQMAGARQASSSR